MPFDLVFRGATVLDGAGTAPVVADVAVRGQTIEAVGDIPKGVEAARVVDATGLALAPGFIDIHTHSDVSLFGAGAGVNKILQGVTTEVTGNCGFSAFPLADERLSLHSEHLAYLGPEVADLAWRDFSGYAAALEAARPIQNVACLVGHGTLRIAVAGLSDETDLGARLGSMGRLLDESVEQGAFGFSTGLTYVPSMYAPTEEIVVLARLAAARSALYATHSRATAGRERAAIEEAISIGRESGVRVEFSHLAINDPRHWGSAGAALALFEDARREGVDVLFDVYPYDGSASSITQYLPVWLQGASATEARSLLSDAATRDRARTDLSRGWYGGIPWMWERVLVTQTLPEDLETPGNTVAELSDSWACDPAEAFLRVFERFGNLAQVAMLYRTEEDMTEFLRHPASAVGSDAVAVVVPGPSGTAPHPRFFGTFPRVLGRYVRDNGVLTLEDAVRKMTGEPADRCGITRRGYLREGQLADIVLFSPAEVADAATFLEPALLPTGIKMVVVNGTVVVEDGRWNGESAGQVLRHGR